AVVTGQPARMATWRAMLRPVAPSGLAHPMMTSSISAASTPARSIACRNAWPPMSAPCVRLNAPRQLLHSGVRAVDTMTASGMGDNLSDLHAGTVRDRRRARDRQLEPGVRADVRLAGGRCGRPAGERPDPAAQPRAVRAPARRPVTDARRVGQ